MLVYQVENLVKRYAGHARAANDSISFQVREGEIFGILGENGAGKTTLIKQMVNLLRPTAGSVRLYGKPIARDALYLPSIVGYMPQESLALNQLTAAEALYYSAHLRGMRRREAQGERERLLEMWGLTELRDQYNSRLSGGQRRLLRLAVATAGRPRALLLDEPTNDLDPQKRRMVWDNLRQLNQAEGTTIIFITHDALEAEKIIQRVGILHRGAMIATGEPHALKKNLASPFRLDITVDDDNQPPRFPAGIRRVKLSAARWQLYPEAHELTPLLQSLDADRLAHINLSSATLEDLYFHYVDNNDPPK